MVLAASAVAATQDRAHNFEPASACAGCHPSEYRQWRTSWMSRSFTNPVFQNDYATMHTLEGRVRGADQKQCLRCHAPMAVIAEGGRTDSELSTDGVTCDLCHSVALIREAPGAAALGIDPRGVRYGVDPGSGSPHLVGQSKALRDPRLCAACHHDVLPGGVPLERTYEEWAASRYAEAGVVCVDCHMSPTPVVDADRGTVSHRFPGGHSDSPLLPGAAVVSLAAATDGVVEATVSNVRVGHNFPTAGAHRNRLILRVALIAGQEIRWQAERVYRFEYLNRDGLPADGVEPVASVRDTTLGPLESRVERFELPHVPGAARFEAELVYELVPPADRERIGAELFDRAYAPVQVHRAWIDLSGRRPRDGD